MKVECVGITWRPWLLYVDSPAGRLGASFLLLVSMRGPVKTIHPSFRGFRVDSIVPDAWTREDICCFIRSYPATEHCESRMLVHICSAFI